MGRLEELRINAYLSEVARGYSNNALVAQHLFPEITSEKEKIDIFEFNKEAFNIYDTERAIRANSNVISPQGFKKHTTTLTEHDLSYPIDYREEQEAEKVKLQLHATNVVTEGLKLKLEKRLEDFVDLVNESSIKKQQKNQNVKMSVKTNVETKSETVKTKENVKENEASKGGTADDK